MTIIKKIVWFLALMINGLFLGQIPETSAQCAMCSLNAENSVKEGNTQGKGLNDGVLFLLAMPFLIGAGIGLLWYKKFRVSSDGEARSSSL